MSVTELMHQLAEFLQHEENVIFVGLRQKAYSLNQFASATTYTGNLKGRRELSASGKKLRGSFKLYFLLQIAHIL